MKSEATESGHDTELTLGGGTLFVLGLGACLFFVRICFGSDILLGIAGQQESAMVE